MAKVVDIGAFSAYAIAKKYGYNGTEAEWVAAQEAARVAAETAAANAAKSAENAAQIEASIGAKGAEAVDAVKAQETQSVAAVGAAGAAQVETIRQEGAAQVQAVEQKGAEVLGSIPQDYTDAMYAKAPVIVETMKGAICATDIAVGAPLHGLTLYGKTAQDGTPSPETPVPLVSAGDGGSVEVNVVGKNLLPDTISPSAIFTGGPGNVYTAAGTGADNICTVRLLAGVTYTLSATLVSGYGNLPCLIFAAQDGTSKKSNYGNVNIPVTYTATENEDVNIRLLTNTANTTTTKGDSYAVMLEVGNTATAFEPYKDGGTLIINTPNGLPGIPVTSGGNYTDENGQQWICDEVDLERGVYVQRVKAYQPSTFALVSVGGAPYRMIAYTKEKLLPLVGLCNAMIHSGSLWGTDVGFSTNVSGEHGAIYVNLPDKFTTADELNAYIADTPMTFVCALETPIETPIPAEDLPDYRTLHTIKSHTTVYNDAGAGMAVDYAADTKGYIDQKIAAIAAAVL